MSLSAALSVALSGLQTSTAAAQMIAANISNADTEGYTAKRLNIDTRTDGGVQVTGYTRATNSALTSTLNDATSSAAYYGTLEDYMTQVQHVLDSSSNPPALSSAMSDFESAWTEYASNPSDTTLEKSLIYAGQKLASEFASIASDIQTLRTNVETELASSVAGLNTALRTVQTLNIQITKALCAGQSTADLEDQRDIAINEIAQYTNVTVMQRDQGEVALYTNGGCVLLDGDAQQFGVGSDTKTVVNASGSDVSTTLSGGILQSQVEFLGTATSSGSTGVLSKMESQLQNLANCFIATTAGGTSFADIYEAAGQGSFFTATLDATTGLPDISSVNVNQNLLDGTVSVPAEVATDITDLFSSLSAAITTTPSSGAWTYTTGASFSATGLNVINQTFSDIVTSILSGFQQTANAINTLSSSAQTQEDYYRSAISSSTGVDTDAELVALTSWENSYAATAHVISTVQNMLQILENMV